jgi:GT2 family glycosyltransferase/glycosyltransferase involved in cell wall biosynthesis
MDPHPEHQIAPGVRGWLESPATDVIASDCLAVAGWAFVDGVDIVDVWSTGLGARRPLQCGIRREDVARIYPDRPTAFHSGFTGYFELDGAPDERVNFDIWAKLSDGRSVRLFQRGLHTRTAGPGETLMRAAVRQLVQRPGTLLSGRSWMNAFRLLTGVPLPHAHPAPIGHSATGKARLRRETRAALASFLSEGSRLTFTAAATPVVSVVVVVWNHADLTLKCLRALAEQVTIAMEVIIVDNASTDETTDLLARVSGATVIRNSTNLGFTLAINIGGKAARGDFLLFVNNDAALEPGAIHHLVETARCSRSIGVVGGKLVYPDGRLQEAGSIIRSDGSCAAYGHGGDPNAPEHNFERRVDFCSAALMLTRREIFEDLGGFDERYRPAYYDDADYCVRVWTRGHSVVYQPQAAAVHYEFGSTSPEASMELQLGRKPIFVATHRRWLASQSPGSDHGLQTRSHPHRQPSVIVVDDAVPDPRMGSGFPRAAALVRALAELGYLITLYVTNEGQERPEGAPAAMPSRGQEDPKRGISESSRWGWGPSAIGKKVGQEFPTVEVIRGGPGGLREFFKSRRFHQLVIVSRPHNMRYVKAAVGSDLTALGAPCIYDAEAIYALREIARRHLLGQPIGEADGRALVDAELALTRGCAAVLAVSEIERRLFEAAGVPDLFVASHAVEPRPTTTPFERRRSILFVGAFSAESPNEDAVLFFCREVVPLLRAGGRGSWPIVVAGAAIPDHLASFDDPAISWHSHVADLTPLYDDARVFVAPTRYAAGISLKVIAAAARGVPIVCTSLVAQQLGWVAGVDVLTADSPTDFAAAIVLLCTDPELWLRLRDTALRRVSTDYSAATFRSALNSALTHSIGIGRVQRDPSYMASSEKISRM